MASLIRLSVCLGSCPPSPAIVVVKKPGGDEMVLDLAADFETVSGVDDEKYALSGFLSHHGHSSRLLFSLLS